jgi:hypothetical protein
MKNKRELPKPTSDENTAGITRFILVEDLTPDNHRALAALSKSKLPARCGRVDGRIKFTKADRPDVVLTVKSVYDSVAKITFCCVGVGGAPPLLLFMCRYATSGCKARGGPLVGGWGVGGGMGYVTHIKQFNGG